MDYLVFDLKIDVHGNMLLKAIYVHGNMLEPSKTTRRTMDHLPGTTEANDTYSKIVAADLKELVENWIATEKPEDTTTAPQDMDGSTAQPPTKKRTRDIGALLQQLSSVYVPIDIKLQASGGIFLVKFRVQQKYCYNLRWRVRINTYRTYSHHTYTYMYRYTYLLVAMWLYKALSLQGSELQ